MTSLFDTQQKKQIVEIANKDKNNYEFRKYIILNKLVTPTAEDLKVSEIRQFAFINKQIKFDQLQKEDFTYEFILECANLDLLNSDMYNFLDDLYFQSGIKNQELENIFVTQIILKIIENDRDISKIPNRIFNDKNMNDYMVNYISENIAFVSFQCCDMEYTTVNHSANRSYSTSKCVLFCKRREGYVDSYGHRSHEHHNYLNLVSDSFNYKFGFIIDSLPFDNNSGDMYMDVSWVIDSINKNKDNYSREKIQDKINYFKNDEMNLSITYKNDYINSIHKEFIDKILINLSNRKQKLRGQINNSNKKNYNYDNMRKHTISRFNLSFKLNFSNDYKKYYIANYDFPLSEMKVICKYVCDNNYIDLLPNLISKTFYDLEKDNIYKYVCDNKLFNLMSDLISKPCHTHNDFKSYIENLDSNYWLNAFDNKKVSFVSEIPQKYHDYFAKKITILNIPNEWYNFDVNSIFGTAVLNIGLFNNTDIKFKNIDSFLNLIMKLNDKNFMLQCFKSFNDKNFQNLKNYLKFDYNNQYGQNLFEVMIKNNFIDDKKALFNIISNNTNENIIKIIVDSNIMFDYYDYEPNTKAGNIFLKNMIIHKHYKVMNKLINFIVSSLYPSEIFMIGINNGFLNKKDINPEYLLDVEYQTSSTSSGSNDCLKCVVCFDDITKKKALVPCGHTNVCSTCFEKLKNKSCPTCRKEIIMHIDIY